MVKDVRYAARMLRSNPVFTAVAICSLAIGVGANSAIYSLANTLLLRPMPVPQASRIVTVNIPPSRTFNSSFTLSYPDYLDVRDRSHSFSGLLADSVGTFGFAPERSLQPRMTYGIFASANYFRVLDLHPILGRSFEDSEDKVAGRNPVVIISRELWTETFASSPGVVGRKIWLNGAEFTVIGVAPENAAKISQLRPSLWIPLAMTATLWSPDMLTERDRSFLEVKGRLKPGISVAQASAEVSGIAADLRRAYPRTDERLRLRAETEWQVQTEASPPDAILVGMLAALALCVLLVACANVAGLLLSRATARAREIAVRMALGSGRAALIRQLMIENLMLAAGGAVAGLAIAYAAVQFFNTLPAAPDLPLNLVFVLDRRALIFTAVVAAASTFLFGLVPAIRSTNLDLNSSLKERSATASVGKLWGRNAIVAGQVAVSLVLLLLSALLFAGFRGELQRGPGYRVDGLQMMAFNPGLVHATEDQRDRFYKELRDRVSELPNVESAALTSSIPMSQNAIHSIGVVPEHWTLPKGQKAIDTLDAAVTPDYFRTFAIPVIEGRGFLESDKHGSTPVAIVNERFAKQYWPHESAIGKTIRLNDASSRKVEIVGIAKTSKYMWIGEASTSFVYLPFSQNPEFDMTLMALVKNGNPAELAPELRKVVHGIDANMPLYEVRTMRDLYDARAIATPNILTGTVAGLGLMGLLLSVVGLYGVVSYSVSRRTREFGIRMAVGADRKNVTGTVLKQGIFLGASGVAVGLVLGILVSRLLLAQMMFSFGHVSVWTFLLVPAALLATVLAASFIPARRAALTDPMRALRDE